MSVEVSHLDVPFDHALRQHIDAYTKYEFKDRDTVQFVPEGRVELLFQFGSRFLHRIDSDTRWVLRPSGFVGGLHDRAYQVRSIDGVAKCLGIKFKPGSAQYFMHCPQSKLKNKISAIEEVWGFSSRSLIAGMSPKATTSEIATKIRSFLSKRFVNPEQKDINFAHQALRGVEGSMQIAQVAADLGLSTSHFRKKFNDNIGLAPRCYRKVVNVN